MKRIFILLIFMVSIFTFTEVKAEEISDTENNIFSYLEQNYNLNNSNFVILKTSSKYLAVVVDNTNSYFFANSYFYIGIDNQFLPFTYSSINFDSTGNFISFKNENKEVNAVTEYIGSISSLGIIIHSNIDIYNSQEKIEVIFNKNYIKDDDIEPEPSPSPEPTDTPEIDISELEKCDSFVCDISDSILGSFNDEEFPFVRTIFYFLIILLFIFTIISPFLVLNWLIGRWF